MGIIFESTKYNLNFFEDKFFNKYLEKRDDEGDYGNNGDNGDNGGYNQNDQGQVTEQPVQPQSTVPQSSGGSGGGSYTPINLDEVQNNKEEEKSFLDIPMEIIRSKYFLIGCGAFVGLVILFFLLRYLIRHRKKPDLSKNFNRNYTKARDIIKHPDAESLSFDSRDEASGNLYRIESTDSMVKMFHSTDITYEKNNGSMNNSMVNLSQVPKNVSPLTPAHLINNQKSQSDLTNNAHSLPNMPSSSSSISSQDSRTLINNRSRTFSSSNSNGTVKPQRRSRTNSSRARSSSTYYMSSDFVMTPFITKKIPGLEKNVPSEEEFVDYPPTPLPESLDDIPYSDNPDIDSEDTDNIVPPSEQIQKRAHSLPSSQNSPVSNRQMTPEHSQSQPMPQVPVRKQSQPMVQQSPPAQIPVRKQSQPMVQQQSPPAPVRMQSQPMVQQSPSQPPAPVRMQSQPRVQQSPPPPAPIRMQSQQMVQQSPPQPAAPIRMQSQPMVQQSPPATPARKQSQTVNPQQQMMNRLPPQPIQQVPPIQTRTPQQTPNRNPSQPMPQQSPQRVQAYPNNQQSTTPTRLQSQNNMGSSHSSPAKQTFVPNNQSPTSPQPYRINQRGGPPKPQPRMSSRMEQSHPVEKQINRQSVVSVHFEIPENKELSFEEEMLASFDKFSSSFDNLENVNAPNPRVAHTKQVI